MGGHMLVMLYVSDKKKNKCHDQNNAEDISNRLNIHKNQN